MTELLIPIVIFAVWTTFSAIFVIRFKSNQTNVESDKSSFWNNDWVIIGGESGNENGKYLYREAEIGWFHKIIGDCCVTGVSVFNKQLGTHLAKQLKLTDRHGGNADEWDDSLQIRMHPLY